MEITIEQSGPSIGKSFTAAKQIEAKYYFTGVPCKNGHVSKRYAANGECWECRQEWRKRNRDVTNKKQNFDRKVRREIGINAYDFKKDLDWRLKNYGSDISHMFVRGLLSKIKWRRTKEEARTENKNIYFTGEWCSKGHVGYRKTKDGRCLICFILGRRSRGKRSALGCYNTYHRIAIPRYETYRERLLPVDSPKTGFLGSITVNCYYCGKRFTPSHDVVAQRSRAIIGATEGEHNLYCSDECKTLCPIYRFKSKSIDPRSILYIGKTDMDKARACQTDHLKQLQCDDKGYNYCERCGDIIDVELHHTLPVSRNGEESISSSGHMLLCAGCHVDVHRKC